MFVRLKNIRNFVPSSRLFDMRKSSRTQIVMPLLLLLIVAFSCGKADHEERIIKSGHADSVLFNVGLVKDYDRMLVLADSFEAVGDLSKLDANRWRGVAYYRQGQYRKSEQYYWKALESKAESDEDMLSA